MDVQQHTSPAVGTRSQPPARLNGEVGPGHGPKGRKQARGTLADPVGSPDSSGNQIPSGTVSSTEDRVPSAALVSAKSKTKRKKKLKTEGELIRASMRFEIVGKPRRDDSTGLRETRRQLWQWRALCCAAANACMRRAYQDDARHYDDYVFEHGHRPKTMKDWGGTIADLYGVSYKLARLVAPELLSGTASAVAKAVADKWHTVRFDVMRNRRAPDFYRDGGAWGLRAQDVRFREIEPGKAYSLRLPLFSQHYEGRTAIMLTVRPRDARQRELLANISSGQWRLGEIKLSEDRIRLGRWFVRLSYKRIVQKSTEPNIGAIHRGLKNAITVVTNDGDLKLVQGAELEAKATQWREQRKRYQRQAWYSGRKGRGRKRILRPTDRLFGKIERWRNNWIQTTAREIAKWLAARRVGVVHIEDMSNIRDGEPERLRGQTEFARRKIWERIQDFPLYQIEMRIKSCLEELGITVMQQPAHWHSERCPVCATSSPEHVNLSRWRIVCSSCKSVTHLDKGAGLNLLARGEAARKSVPYEVIHAGGETADERAARNGATKPAKSRQITRPRRNK